MMIFADAQHLWVLIPLFVGWAALWFWTSTQRDAHQGGKGPGAGAVLFSRIRNLQRLRMSKSVRLRRLILGSRLLTVALLMVAMARPQTGRKQAQVISEGVDIMLAIDTSGSMQALDLDADRPITHRRNRLEVVKEVVGSFIRQREHDQIGMVVFGEQAFTQCPLTLDHGILATFVDQVEIGMAGDATAIGSALGTAVNRLKKSKAKSRVIVLLTDGRNNAGSLEPRQAAQIAKTFGIKIYAVGAGTRGKAPFLVEGLFGKQIAFDDVQIDEAMLEQVAKSTGGSYFRAEDVAALKDVYAQIDRLEKTEIKMNQYLEYNERYSAFVWPAVFLLLAEVVLIGTRFRKLP